MTGPATLLQILISIPAAAFRLYFALLVVLVSSATDYSEVKLHVSKTFVKDYALIKVSNPISMCMCRQYVPISLTPNPLLLYISSDPKCLGMDSVEVF